MSEAGRKLTMDGDSKYKAERKFQMGGGTMYGAERKRSRTNIMAATPPSGAKIQPSFFPKGNLSSTLVTVSA